MSINVSAEVRKVWTLRVAHALVMLTYRDADRRGGFTDEPNIIGMPAIRIKNLTP